MSRKAVDLPGALTGLFRLLFAVCFTFVIASVLFRGAGRSAEQRAVSAAGTAVCLAVLCLLARLAGRHERVLEENYHKILAVFSAAMFTLELLFALALRHGTWHDVGALHQGAAEWAETGTFAGFYEYYGYFPNNLGGMAFLYVFFKAASLAGFTDYYAAASLAACVMLTSMMAVVSLICRRLAGAVSAVLLLAVFALSAQFWVLGGAVYTDTLSMLFPVLIFYLYLLSRERKGRKKACLYLLMGLATGVGSLNKVTVLIMVIAVLADAGLRLERKELLKLAACTLGAAAAMNLALNAYMYSAHLSREEAVRHNTPLLHWVMMGLRGDGRYNPEDYVFTRSLAPEQRNAALLEEIGRRVAGRGVTGMLDLFSQKSAIDFGDGTYGADDFLKIYPERDTVLHDFVLKDGRFYWLYGGYTTALHIALMLSMLIAAYRHIAGGAREREDGDLLLPLYLAVFGVWLFLMFWEASPRYFSNFAPVIIVCGVLGIPRAGAAAVKPAGGRTEPGEGSAPPAP